ncbi:hypothetical protein FHR81_000622 [Actinoalloteichus hoggarensis]|uniref:Stress responsive A/B Barrel Domain protein n=1 Tax=Actinoalloteichus hoggarensis TaxID=1470176 RepID=A0A221W1P5_9PSEU|nr:Dabb family protein [Actinoalloteichus hoggarensis]ASO19700.1 Stress responsive A/B Barrel Domain protein [Actinoalloteichus hoggarensis]MBB5919593.1 hypothetical protein [Actinoalloteichus hoggarensis]
MIYHCIRFTIKPEVPQETVDAIIDGMGAQNADSPGAVFGRDFGGEYQYAAVSSVADLEEYEKMMNDPAHLQVDRMGLPLIERFASFDVTDDKDPEMGEKIAAIHQRRFDAHPDLVELISNLKEYIGSAAPGRHATS